MNAASRSRPGRKRRRVIAGGAVAGLVALGFWLNTLIPGLGLGFGSGSGIGTGDDASLNRSKTKTPEDKDVKKALTPDVVEVRIDGNRYLLKSTTGGTEKFEKEVTLDDIVKLAGKALGDDNGVKVRIFKLGTSVLDQEDKLKAALTAAGLKTTEIETPRIPQ